jgi:hypothetical protein
MKRLSIIIALAAMLGGQAYQVQAQGFTVNKKDGKTETYQAKDINKMQPVKITNSAIVDGQEQTSSESGVLIWMKDGSFKQYGESEFTNISMFGAESSDPTPGVRKVSQAYKDYVGSPKMRDDVKTFVEGAALIEAMNWEFLKSVTDNFNAGKNFQGNPESYDYTKFLDYTEEFGLNFEGYVKAMTNLKAMGILDYPTPVTRGIGDSAFDWLFGINRTLNSASEKIMNTMRQPGMNDDYHWSKAFEAVSGRKDLMLGCTDFREWRKKINRGDAGHLASYIYKQLEVAEGFFDAGQDAGYGNNPFLNHTVEVLKQGTKDGIKVYAGAASAGNPIIGLGVSSYNITESTLQLGKALKESDSENARDAMLTITNTVANMFGGGFITGEIIDGTFSAANKYIFEPLAEAEKAMGNNVNNTGSVKVKDKDTKSPGKIAIVTTPSKRTIIVTGGEGEITIPTSEEGEYEITIVDENGDKFTGTETVTDPTKDTEIEVSTNESETLEVDPTIPNPEVIDYNFTLVPSDIHFAADGGTIYVTVEGDGVEYIESTSSATWLGFSFMTGSKSLALIANPNADKDERSTSFWVAVMMKDGSVITRYFWSYQDGGAVEPEPEEPDIPEVLQIPTEIRNQMPTYEGNSVSIDSLVSFSVTQFELVCAIDDEQYLDYYRKLMIDTWDEEEEGPLTDEQLERLVNGARVKIPSDIIMANASTFNVSKKGKNKIALQAIDGNGELDDDWVEFSLHGTDNKFTLYNYTPLGVGYWHSGACVVISGVLEDGYIKDLYYAAYYLRKDGSLSSYYILKEADGISKETFKGSQSRAVSLSPIAPKTTKGDSIFAPWTVKSSKQ